jgi:exodeoxyribonuclease VII large subunit
LIDDVAAVCCSTPTHAAEAAVGVDCAAARATLLGHAVRIDKRGRAAVLDRARALVSFSRAPRERVAAHRTHLHQKARELRAASRRGLALRLDHQRRMAAQDLDRKREVAVAAAGSGRARLNARAAALARAADALEARRREALRSHAAAIRGHDPERALERGYAIALDPDGRPLSSAAAVREASDFELRMADGHVPARVHEEVDE